MSNYLKKIDLVVVKGYKQIVVNFFYLLLLQLSSIVIPFVLFPHLTSVLSESNFGLIILSLSLTQFLSILMDFGYNLSATPIIAKNAKNSLRLSFTFSNAMYSRFLLLITLYFLFFLACLFIDNLREDFWFHQLSYLFVLGNFMFPIWFFQGMQEMKFITIVGVSTKGISTLLAYIFIQNNSEYYLYPIFLGLASIISGLFALWIIFNKFKIQLIPIKSKFITSSLKDSSGFFLSRLSISYLLFINPFLLSLFASKAIVGFYGIAEKFYNILQAGYRPVVAVLYPYMAQKKDLKLYRIVIISICLINTIVCLIAYFYIEPFLALIFDSYSVITVDVFRVLVVASFFFVPSQLLGYPLLGALGHGREANLSVVIVTIFHLIFLSILIILSKIDVYSLSTVIVFVHLGILMVRIIYIKRKKINVFIH